MSERRAILTHYRTEEAKAFRRLYGDTGGVQVSRQISQDES